MSPVRKEDRLPSKQGVRGQEDKEGKAFNEIGLLYKRPEVIFHSEKKERGSQRKQNETSLSSLYILAFGTSLKS